jgi:hypothetical protein
MGEDRQAIADELGYANRGTVYRLVKNALEDREVETIDEFRELEVARLDSLQAAVWEKAVSGDFAAIATVLKVLHVRAKILGLYSHNERTCPHAAKTTVVR